MKSGLGQNPPSYLRINEKNPGEPADEGIDTVFLPMNCPKCGFEQNEGLECLRCGVIFARCHPTAETPGRRPEGAEAPVAKPAGTFRRYFRIFRYFSIAVGIIVLFLMLRTSPPPPIAVSAEATQRAQTKIEQFQSALGQGKENKLEMEEPELNGWLHNNIALKKQAGADPSGAKSTESLIEMAKVATGGGKTTAEELEQAQSSVRDVAVQLRDDTLVIYTLFDFHGKDLSLELEGQPVVRDGYLKLEPLSGRFGSLPLTSSTLRSVADRLFESPENKEKFKLPPNIQDIRIEQGRFVVTSR
jgi:hypothetical protein